MGFLLEVFPNYFPDAGLRAVDAEFRNGTVQSQTAAIWLLQDALRVSTFGLSHSGGVALTKTGRRRPSHFPMDRVC